MNPSNRPTDGVLAAQRTWAERQGIAVDEFGYVSEWAHNLRQELSPAAKAAFESASGSELTHGTARRAKMCALHSSSALAVNAFDFWTGRDLDRVVEALGVDGRPAADRPLQFERKLPTGARGTPPNLDIVITLEDHRLIGVESKFTEWMTPKRDLATSLKPYVEGDASRWSKAGLRATHASVLAMLAGTARFEYLVVCF